LDENLSKDILGMPYKMSESGNIPNCVEKTNPIMLHKGEDKPEVI